MPSTWNSVASSGRDWTTIPRSSFRIRWTHSMIGFAEVAGCTVKSWSYLFLKYRASFARRPPSAAATGEDTRPTVETVVKSTVWDVDVRVTVAPRCWLTLRVTLSFREWYSHIRARRCQARSAPSGKG